jgi:hypothetical protein
MADDLTFPNNICSSNADGSGVMTACSGYGYINQAYGDTANVNVVYQDLVNTGDSLRWWGTGYNDLPTAVFGGNSDAPGASLDLIQILPVGGYSIQLNSFDLGAWPDTQRNTNLEILDGNGNALLNYGTQLIGAGNVATHFAPDIISANGIGIEWGSTGFNVGIDNIDFTVEQTSSVPEPSAWVLFGTCALAMASGQLRRRTKGNAV